MQPAVRGGDAWSLARASLAQQGTQLLGLFVLLIVITVLGRKLTLSEFGTYGLIASIAVYLLVVQRSVANSTVRAMAGAADSGSRATVFSAASPLYAAAAVVTAILITVTGFTLSELVLSGDLAQQAMLGTVALAIVTMIGVIYVIYLDALRGSLLFVRAAGTEVVGLTIFLALLLTLVAADAELWILIGASGALPMIDGVLATLVVRATRLPYRYGRLRMRRDSFADLLPTAGYLLIIESSSLVIYALDRTILGVFKGPAAVGLYEGPIRVHNFFFAVNAALTVTALPAASKYEAGRDQRRMGELVTRGSRYSLALIVPLAVTVMILAEPLLRVWLGAEFGAGASALSILVSYWLLYGAVATTPGLLVGAGKAQEVARLMATVAIVNLALSLSLTPSVGLEGPAVGTAVSYGLGFPLLLHLSLSLPGVHLSELARHAWMPAYLLGACLAIGLVAVRISLPLETLPAVICVFLGGPALYWLAYYLLILHPDERSLIRELSLGVCRVSQP